MWIPMALAIGQIVFLIGWEHKSSNKWQCGSHSQDLHSINQLWDIFDSRLDEVNPQAILKELDEKFMEEMKQIPH